MRMTRIPMREVTSDELPQPSMSTIVRALMGREVGGRRIFAIANCALGAVVILRPVSAS